MLLLLLRSPRAYPLFLLRMRHFSVRTANMWGRLARNITASRHDVLLWYIWIFYVHTWLGEGGIEKANGANSNGCFILRCRSCRPNIRKVFFYCLEDVFSTLEIIYQIIFWKSQACKRLAYFVSNVIKKMAPSPTRLSLSYNTVLCLNQSFHSKWNV